MKTPSKLASSLYSELCLEDWFFAVGEAGDELVVYVAEPVSKVASLVPRLWRGLKVRVEHVDDLVALAQARDDRISRSREEPERVLICNKIRCLRCDTVLESTHRHHFNSCDCDPYVAADGGLDYIRRVGDPNHYEELSEWKTV